MKRLSFFLVLIVLVIVTPRITFADHSVDLNAINKYIENEYLIKSYYQLFNFKKIALNSSVSNEYDVVAYGQPSNGKYSNLTNQFEPRYLGVTNSNEKLPNYSYAYDTKSSIYFDDMNWIVDPHSSALVFGDPRYSWISENQFSDLRKHPKIMKSFLAGMHYQHGNGERPAGDWFRGDEVNRRGERIEWERYMHIIDPPTEWTHGSAMLWHVSELDGKLYYIDVRLTRFMDLVGKLQVRHRTVGGQRLSAHDFSRSMVDGVGVSVTGKDIDGYQYVGFGVSASNGTAPLQSEANEFSMVYDYRHDRQLYTVTFYYEPLSVDLELKGSGAIRISHPVYDVTLGIPTGSRANIEALVDKPFMMDFRTERVTGSQSAVVLVQLPYTLEWEGEVDKRVAEERVVVTSDYAYYRVTQLFAYGLSHVKVLNAKLREDGEVTLSAFPKGWKLPRVTFERPDAYVSEMVIEGSYYREDLGCYVLRLPLKQYIGRYEPTFYLAAEAQKAVKGVRVRSDHLAVGSQVLVDGSWSEGQAAEPRAAVEVQEVLSGPGPVELSMSEFEISHGIANGEGETNGAAYYRTLARWAVPERIPVVQLEGNPVVVHTPVAARAALVKKPLLDQRPVAVKSQANAAPALPLEALMRVNLGTEGDHLPIPGYGARDYGAYAKVRRLYLPFDAYCFWNVTGTDGGFVSAGSWVVVPADVHAAFVRAPAWVEPGPYELLYQVVALNHRSPAKHQLAVNLDPANDIAGAAVPVMVTGRLYGFAITDLSDARWAPFPPKGYTSNRLPIRQGSHPNAQQMNLAPKPGNVIRFKVNSLGPYFQNGDLIYIKVGFSHIPKGTNQRVPVDVYYRQGTQWVRVGDGLDKFEWHSALQNGRKDLPLTGIATTGRLMDTLPPLENSSTGVQWLKQTLIKSYVSKVRSIALGPSRRLLGQSNPIIWPSEMEIPQGPSSNITSSEALSALYPACFQTWYGEYLLPNQLMVVPKGQALVLAYASDNKAVLTSGTLGVNFTVSLCRELQIDSTELEYGQQWSLEGLKTSQHSWPIATGDVIFYPLEVKASNDWK